MLHLIKMPKLSPTMEFGTIVKWHKKNNDKLEDHEVLLEIATDKATVEHSLNETGYIRVILAEENSKIPINSPLCILSDSIDEPCNVDEFLASQTLPHTHPIEESSNHTSDPLKVSVSCESSSNLQRTYFKGFLPETPDYEESPLENNNLFSPKISPLAKKIAKEKNLDLTCLKGSGPGGRIIEKDLVNAPQNSSLSISKRLFSKTASNPAGSYEETPLSFLREAINDRLTRAKTTIPHFYVKHTVNAEFMLEFRKDLIAEKQIFSINDLVIKSCALALRDFPEINSGFNSVNNNLISFKTIDISFAVAIPDGIITPIIRYADHKDLLSIATESKRLTLKAKEGSLKENNYKGGSFCISNLGMMGIEEFTSIINPPQAAILAVGSILPSPIIKNSSVCAGHTMKLNLSVDHRVVDGMTASLFLKRICYLLEKPHLLLLN